MRREHVERAPVEDQHLPVVGLDEGVAADSEGQVPELERHRIIEQGDVRQEFRDSVRKLRARPCGLGAVEAQAPQKAAAARLNREEKVLQTLEMELVRGARECGQRILDALVVDEAAVDRQHQMRSHAVKAEAPRAGSAHRLELAADAVAPRVVHAQDGSVRRQAKARACPRLLHHPLFQLQLMRVGRVLQLAAAARAEVGTRRRDAMW